MAIFRTLFVLLSIFAAGISLSAQTTWYLRADGDPGNNGLTAATAKRQIEDIPVDGAGVILADGDVIDIGAGDFNGGIIGVSVHIAGANAGNAVWNGAAETNLGELTFSGAGQAITIEGVRWSGGVVPVVVSGTEAVITITNSHFDAAGAITATDANWNELYVSNSAFDGDYGANQISNAIVTSNLDIVNIRENTFTQYVESAVFVTGAAGSTVSITYNDFNDNNVGGGPGHAAVAFASVADITAADIQNNLFTSERNGVVTSGTISSGVNVRYNKFVTTVGGFYAVKNLGTGSLTATCNNYGSYAPSSTVKGLFTGTMTVLPYNFEGTDENGGDIGFEPNEAEECSTSGPVKSSTTSGFGASYFTISEAITASAAGATVMVLATDVDTYDENLTVNKSLSLHAWSDENGKTPMSVDTSDDGRTRSRFVNLNGKITITSAAGTVDIRGFRVTRSQSASNTDVNLITTNASGSTTIRNCFLNAADNGNPLSGVPSTGVVHVVRAGDIKLQQTKVFRPSGADHMRALTFASGNGCRNVSVVSNNLQGTVQISGLSALSDVRISDNLINGAGVDGVSVTGNYARTLNVVFNTITNSRENGIAWRNGSSIGSNVANINNNLITGSGHAPSGGPYAGINIGASTTGTNHSYAENSLFSQAGSSKNFINSRNGFTAAATCSWWGHIYEDDVLSTITGAVTYDNGTEGWNSTEDNDYSLVNGFESQLGCTVRSMSISFLKTNVSCQENTDGALTAEVTHPGGEVITYGWSILGDNVNTRTNVASGTHTLTVVSSTLNQRTVSVTVNEPTLITAMASATDITCYAATDGTITVDPATGGTHDDIGSRSYHYAVKLGGTSTIVDGPGTSRSFTGLDAGTYDVWVTALASTNGTITNPACETLVHVGLVITRPAEFAPGEIETTGQTICTGTSAGTIGSVSLASGGNGEYSYQWQYTNGMIWIDIEGATDATYSPGILNIEDVPLIYGVHQMEYRRMANDGLCSTTPTASIGTWTVTVHPNAAIEAVSGVAALCIGATDGYSTVNANLGGTGSGAWSSSDETVATVDNAGVVTAVSAGTTDITYTITGGCDGTKSASQTLTVYPAFFAGSIEIDGEEICFGGTPVVTIGSSEGAVGGDGNVMYSWRSSADGYTAAIDGADESSFVPPASAVTTSYRRYAKEGSCSDWTASAGTWTVTVPDAQLSATVVKTNITCFSATDGTITVSAPQGGYGTYETSIDGTNYYSVSGASSYQFDELVEGTYTVRLRDAAQTSCEVTYERVIWRPTQLAVTVSTQNTSCGGVDGVITLSNPEGGTHPELGSQEYEYTLRNDANNVVAGPQTSLTFNNLTAQVYVLTMTAKDVSPTCSREFTGIVILGADAITADVAKTNITCNGSVNGTITVTGTTGGTTALVTTRDYRYRLENLGTSTTTALQTSGSFTGLAAGTYGVDVVALETGNTPACTTRVATSVIFNPSTVTSTTSKVNISKNGLTDGEIEFTSTDGGVHTDGDVSSRDYEYFITMEGGSTTGPQESGTFTGLSAGTYTTFVIALAQDSTPACTTQVASQVILEPSAVTADIATTNITCNADGNGTLTVSGTTGGTHEESTSRTYSYQVIRNGGGYNDLNGSGEFTGMTAGTYTVYVFASAANEGVTPACTTAISTTVEIYEPTPVTTTSAVVGVDPSCHGGTNGTINVQGGAGGTHGAIEGRDYEYTIFQTEVGATTGPQTSALFTGLGAGTYNVYVTALATGNNPSCSTYVDQIVLGQPTAVTHSMVDDANTTAPYIKATGTVTFTITASGGTPKSHASPSAVEPHYNVTWATKPDGVADPDFVSSTETSGTYTMVYTLSNVDPDAVSGDYEVTITDNNDCPSSDNGSVTTMVSVYATTDLYVENINGSNATGTGTSSRPLASITKAIDVASTGETINVMQNTSGSPAAVQINEAPDGPVITKPLTFKRVAFEYNDGVYSGLMDLTTEPLFATNQAFVLGTSAVTFSGFTPTALHVNNSGTIQEAIDEISTTGTVTLLAGSEGTYDLGSPLSISKGITLQGSPTNLVTSDCDMEPTSVLRVAGTTKMMLFSGTATKTLRNLNLTVGKDPSSTTTGRFFEIQNGSSGNVNASNIIYKYNNGSSVTRIFGITNDDRSVGVLNDVAKFVNDVADNAGFGTGRVTYGEQGPLPYTSLEIGWKAEDAGTSTDNLGISQLYPMVGTLQLRPGTTATRPLWRNTTNGLNSRAALQFNGTTHYLAASATNAIISGGAKSLMVTFKTPDVDVTDNALQVIYKHGDHQNGMSIVLVGTTSSTTETIRMSIYDYASSTQRTVSRDFINVAKGTTYIAQMYFNGADATNRIGMSLDGNDGQVAVSTGGTEVKLGSGSFGVTTLTAPTLSAATNVSLGAKSGSVRFGEGATAGTTGTTDFNNTAGIALNFGGNSSGTASTTSRIAEVLLYNTASKGTRDAAYCYLRNKYLSSSAVDNGLEKGDPTDDVIAGDVEFMDEIDVYPNPAESDLTITVAARQAGQLKVEMVDALGRVVNRLYDGYATQNFILPLSADVRAIASGTYVIRVTGAGDLNMSQPVIIRR